MKGDKEEIMTLESLIEKTLRGRQDGGLLDLKAEALRKALKRDAYFLDQEKKWLEEEKKRVLALKQTLGSLG